MDLINRFDYLKNKLFPYWDVRKEWKITNNHEIIKEIEDKINYKFIGYCHRDSKTICLNLHENDWKIEVIIVHEICHSFPNCGNHGISWKNKMLMVSDRCDKLNYYRLADQIRHELENYELV